jgi:hypothetical protein
VAPPSPVSRDAMVDAVRAHPPRPSRRHAATFGSRPNARVDADEVPPGTTIAQSSYVQYPAMDGLSAPEVHRSRDSGFSRQLTTRAPMTVGEDANGLVGSQVGRKGFPMRPSDTGTRVPRLDLTRLGDGGAQLSPSAPPSVSPSARAAAQASARARRGRSEAVGMTVGRKTESGFVAGNRVVANPRPFRGSTTYRDSYERRSFANGTEPLPTILRGERGTGFAMGNKTERAGVPGVHSTNPRDLYPRHIHPKVMARIKARDPVEFTNLLHVDRPMMSLYRAQFEKLVGEGDGLASAGRGDWDDVQSAARDLTLEPTAAERIAAARKFIGTKELSSFVRNNQPNLGVTADMMARNRTRGGGGGGGGGAGGGGGDGDGDGMTSTTTMDADRAAAEDAARWVSVAHSSFRVPIEEFPPREHDIATRSVQASGFQRSVTALDPAGDDPSRRVHAKKRVDL